MGKLTKRAGRTFATGVLVLAGTGILMLAGTGTANAQPASASACAKINSTLASLDAQLKNAHTTLKASAALIASQLTAAASNNTPPVKNAVHTFVTDLVAGADAGDLDSAKLNADANAIVAACAAANTPVGAPATGGGSTAGLQDPALFGLGGAAALAGIVVVGLALRNRRRTGAGYGWRPRGT
jgi:hypothetical protein